MTPNFLAVIKFRIRAIRAIRVIRGTDRLKNSIHRKVEQYHPPEADKPSRATR